MQTAIQSFELANRVNQ